MRLPDPHRSYAVLIGTSRYRSSDLQDVPHVTRNLAALKEVLTDPALGGLPAERCIVRENPTDGLAVVQELRTHAVAAQDTLLVYYAGHGLAGERFNELFLGLPGTDPEALHVSALPIREVREILSHRTPADNRVLILDCCYSGRVIETHLGSGNDGILAQIGIEGTYTLTSAPGTTLALYDPGATYTAFTEMLLTLLRTGIPEGPELLTLHEIYRQLRLTAIRRELPQPQQLNFGTISGLALTRNPAHTRLRPAPPATTAPQRMPTAVAEDPADHSGHAGADASKRTQPLQIGPVPTPADHGTAPLEQPSDPVIRPPGPPSGWSSDEVARALEGPADRPPAGATAIWRPPWQRQGHTTPEPLPLPKPRPRVDLFAQPPPTTQPPSTAPETGQQPVRAWRRWTWLMVAVGIFMLVIAGGAFIGYQALTSDFYIAAGKSDADKDRVVIYQGNPSESILGLNLSQKASKQPPTEIIISDLPKDDQDRVKAGFLAGTLLTGRDGALAKAEVLHSELCRYVLHAFSSQDDEVAIFRGESQPHCPQVDPIKATPPVKLSELPADKAQPLRGTAGVVVPNSATARTELDKLVGLAAECRKHPGTNSCPVPTRPVG